VSKQRYKLANLNEIYGIALLAAGVLLGLSTFARSSGIVGVYVDSALQVLIGAGRYLLPIFIIFLGLSFLIEKPTFKAHSVGVGLVILSLSLFALFHLSVPQNHFFEARYLAAYGGIFGAVLAYVLTTLFAVIGAYVILSAGVIVGVLITTGISIRELVARVIENRRNRRERKRVRREIKIRRPELPEKRKVEPLPDVEAESGTRVTLESNIFTQPTKQLKIDIDEELAKATVYQLPPVSLLRKTATTRFGSKRGIKENSQLIEQTLRDFDITAEVTRVVKGPTVTRYELQLASGVKVNRVVALSDDIALALATADIRIIAPIPGKSAIGIEVPNEHRELVTLGDILDSEEASRFKGMLVAGIGKDISGRPILADISGMPHLLIAGATGSGKSVCINSILISVLTRARPDEVKMILIDPKRIELTLYTDIPHLLTPVVTNAKQAATALAWVVGEMEERFERLSEAKVRDIRGYNRLATRSKGLEKMPYILVIIDELADLMMVAPAEVEDAVCRIAQLARAVGIHLILATQRPSTDIITGLIKANITCRIAFAVSSQIDSRVILDSAGAEKLVGKGDMLFTTPALPKPVRLQGAYVTEAEIQLMTTYIKKQAKPEYKPEILEEAKKKFGYDFEDELYDEALRIVVESGQASVSLLQRRLRIGYARAARLIDMLEARGVVGPFEGSKPRAVLMTPEELTERKENLF
jgi:S-DNA-T family DNA segregation ATPase FtsK/SpoIIIE